MTETDKKLVDEFDAYAQVFQEIRKYRRREIYLVVFAAFCAVGFLLRSMMPPVVIVKDNINPENGVKVMRPGNIPDIRKVDAESMFIFAVQRRWGWHSTSLMKDMVELRDMLTPDMRTAFLSYVNGYELTEEEANQKGVKRQRRVETWMTSQVRNSIVLPRESIECKASEEEQAWYCRGVGKIETAPMFGEANLAEAVSKKVEFRGKIHPFKYTAATPWGMIISYLDAVNAEEGK